MNILDTYIVCDSVINRMFNNIEHFKIDLGLALTHSRNRNNTNSTFYPMDIQIQSHFINFGEIINRYGTIGALNIYNKAFIPTTELYVINNKNKYIYTIDNNISAFDNINKAIKEFKEYFGLTQNIKIEKEDKVETKKQETEYIKPNKKLSEMTEAERIAYVRNLK